MHLCQSSPDLFLLALELNKLPDKWSLPHMTQVSQVHEHIEENDHTTKNGSLLLVLWRSNQHKYRRFEILNSITSSISSWCCRWCCLLLFRIAWCGDTRFHMCSSIVGITRRLSLCYHQQRMVCNDNKSCHFRRCCCWCWRPLMFY